MTLPSQATSPRPPSTSAASSRRKIQVTGTSVTPAAAKCERHSCCTSLLITLVLRSSCQWLWPAVLKIFALCSLHWHQVRIWKCGPFLKSIASMRSVASSWVMWWVPTIKFSTEKIQLLLNGYLSVYSWLAVHVVLFAIKEVCKKGSTVNMKWCPVLP